MAAPQQVTPAPNRELTVRSVEVETRQASGPNLLEVIATAAANPLVDVGKMQALLDMQERILKKQAEIEFDAAMARVQARLPKIPKKGMITVPGREGKTGHSTPFARYEDVTDAIKPILQEEGFSISYDSEMTATGTVWKVILSRAGHKEIRSMPPMPPDATGSKNAVQALGSTNQYAKRYLLGNAFDLVMTDADDDGRAAGYLTDDQVNMLTDMLNELNLPPTRYQKFLEIARAESIEKIKQSNFGPMWQSLKTLLDKRRGTRA